MKDLIARHFSRAAANYSAVTPVQQQSAEVLFRLLQTNLPVHRCDSEEPVLLDVGMGDGRLFSLFHKHLGCNWELEGIDFAPQMLAEAQKRWPNAHLLCCDAESYEYQLESYNLIVSNFALQWCEAPVQLLQRLCAALRPGGQIAVALPLHGSLGNLAQLIGQLCGETLPLYPLPQTEDFSEISGLPDTGPVGFGQETSNKENHNLAISCILSKKQDFYVEYRNAFEALQAIKLAGAHTTMRGEGSNAAPLSFRALRQLRQHPGPFVLDYQVLFVVLQRS